MNAADAPSYIVGDIGAEVEGGLWRWARRKPAIRVSVPAVDRYRFVMDFGIPDAVFAKTGPITITFAVNGHVLESVRYVTHGTKTFEKLVPSGLLRARDVAILTAEPDKTIPFEEGEELSIVMISAGFKP